ncbi:hypothetical protein [Treponema sp.]
MEEAENLFHGDYWDKRVVMALSGHTTTAMLEHYGKHMEQEKTLAIAK